MPHISASRPLRWAAAGLLMLGLGPLAHAAADPQRGATLYGACAGCHGPAASPSNPAVLKARNASGVVRAAISSNRGGMGSLVSISDADLADIAAFLGNSPGSLAFAATSVGSGSATQSVTVRASAVLPLTSLAATVTGDFERTGGSCAGSLAADTSCTIDLRFKPSAAGSRSGALQLVHNGIADTVQISLAGTGNAAAAPVLTVSGNSLAFGDQVVSTASAAKVLTLGNSGNGALQLSALQIGGAAAADFALGGSCAVGTPVPAGGSCSLTLAFTPGAAGARSATLNINSDGGSGSVALSGNGVAQPVPGVAFSAASIDFGNQAVGGTAATRSLTLANGGTAALGIVSLQASLPFSVASHDCGNSLAAKAQCTVQLAFTPSGTGSASGQLSLASNAAGSPHTVPLAGNGTLAAPQLAWTPALSSVEFGAGPVGAARPPQTLALTNQGPGAATLGGIRLSGDAASDFSVDSSSTCGNSTVLAAGASCQLVLGFAPGAAGARGARLDVVAASGQAPGTLALNGSGSAPLLALSAPNLAFTASSASQSLTLRNSGDLPLRVSRVGVSPAGFASINPGAPNACATAPFELAPGASCELALAWSGAAEPASGTLEIVSDASPASTSVPLQADRSVGAATAGNQGGGGCTVGQGTPARDPALIAMALLSAAMLLWRRRARAARRPGAAL
jgi:hypothetical protein